MKYLNITYHLYNDTETAETCITLPMVSKIADDILKHQCGSSHVTPESAVGRILADFANLQGYDSAAFRYAEERKMPWNDTWKEEADGK